MAMIEICCTILTTFVVLVEIFSLYKEKTYGLRIHVVECDVKELIKEVYALKGAELNK